MYTTALRFEGEDPICPYLTGQRHAGDNLDSIPALRGPELPPTQWMSDTLAATTPKENQDRILEMNGLIHGRRKFVEIDEFFPGECARVINAIAEIYKHDAHCKRQGFTPAQRRAYHQANSESVMTNL